MNGTAARRLVSTPPPLSAPQGTFSSGSVSEPGDLLVRGRSHPGWAGRARQLSYTLIDMFLVCAGGAAVYWLRFGFSVSIGGESISPDALFRVHPRAYPGFLLLYCGLIVLACASQNLYRTHREIAAFVELLRVVKAVVLATTILVLFIFASGNKEISRLVIAFAAVLNVFSLSSWRFAKRLYVLRRADRGIGLSRVLILGAGKVGQAFAAWVESNRHAGYTVCGFLDAHPNGDKRVLGSIADFRRVALAQFADEIVITPPADREVVKEIFIEARKLRLGLHVLPDLYDGLGWRAPLHTIGGFPLLQLYGEPIPALGLAVKRMVDVVAAAAGLVLAAPLLAAAALWIRLDSKGPAIYAAPRVGKKGRKFNCYKLRTMVADADDRKQELRKSNEREGPFFKMEEDPRVTRCGSWLRRFSLDELPQLVNVLRGEMSLVGPRPHPLDDYERYTIEHLRRLDVKPGITGMWQVMARHDPSFERNMELDLEYIEKWSLGLDLQILWKTLPEVLKANAR